MSWFSRPPDVASWSDAQLTAAHAQAQRHVRLLRTWLPVLVLVIIFLYILGIRSTIKSIDGDKLGAALEQKVSALSPKVQRALSDVGGEAGPVVSKALETEANRVVQQFGNKVDEQVDAMRQTLPDKMKGMLDTKMRDLRKAQLVRLQQELPELAKDPKKYEQLLDALSAGTHEWAQKQLTSTFQKHLLEMERLKKTLQKVATTDLNAIAKADGDGKALPAGATPGDVAGVSAATNRISPEQMLAMWLEIFEEAMNGPQGETILDDGDAKAKKHGEGHSAPDAKEVQP